MNGTFNPDWKPADNLPLALQMSGDCPCGEHGHSTFRRRADQGRGRPYLYRVECASCGRPLARFRNTSATVAAAIYSYSPGVTSYFQAFNSLTGMWYSMSRGCGFVTHDRREATCLTSADVARIRETHSNVEVVRALF